MKKRHSLLVDYSKGKADTIRSSLRRSQSTETVTLDRKELVNRSLHALATSSSNLAFNYEASSEKHENRATERIQKDAQVNFRMRRLTSLSNHSSHGVSPPTLSRSKTWNSEHVPRTSTPPSTRAERIKMLIRANSERSLGSTGSSSNCISQLKSSTYHGSGGKRRSSLRGRTPERVNRKATSLSGPEEASLSPTRLMSDESNSSFANEDPPVLIVPTRVQSLAEDDSDDSPVKPRPTLGKKRRSSRKLGLRQCNSMAELSYNHTENNDVTPDRRRQFRRSSSVLHVESNPGRTQQLRRSSRILEDQPPQAFHDSLRRIGSSSSIRRQNSFKNLSIGADASLFITGSRIRRHGSSDHLLKRSTSCRKILEEKPEANFTWNTQQNKRGSLRRGAASFSNLNYTYRPPIREGIASPSA